MLARKQKQNPPPESAPPRQTWKEQMYDAADRAMRRLFHLPEGWHLERNIVKNNFELGVKYYRSDHEQDAVLRLKLATWIDPKHAEAWYWLGRAALANGKRALGMKALEKAAALNHPHAAGLLAAAKAEKVTAAVKESGDAALLSKLHQDAFLGHWSEKEIADMLAIGGTQGWVAGLPALPMGMLLGRALGEQYEILTMAVSPEWRRHGAAKLLLGQAKAAAKKSGARTMFLEVAENNFAARGLYQAEGFTIQSRREGYYKQPNGTFTDALVMKLELA